MNNNPFLLIVQTIIGTVLGGGLVMLADYFKRRNEHRREVQEWYKRAYVDEGVDRLITYFIGLDVHLRTLNLDQEAGPLITLEQAPAAALTHVQVLLGERVLTEIALLLYEYLHHPCIDKPMIGKATSAIGKVNSTLLELHQTLIHAIPTMGRQEIQRAKMVHFVEQLTAVRTDLNNTVANDLIRWTRWQEQQERA